MNLTGALHLPGYTTRPHTPEAAACSSTRQPNPMHVDPSLLLSKPTSLPDLSWEDALRVQLEALQHNNNPYPGASHRHQAQDGGTRTQVPREG